MKTLFVLLGSLLSCVIMPTAACAQMVPTTRPAVQRDPDLTPDRPNASSHFQQLTPLIGNADNVAILSQIGSNNESYIAQAGDDNAARLAILGSGNATVVVQQGNKNLFDMDLTGDNNPVNLVQTGNNNVYNMDLNASNTPVNLVQSGSNNRVNSNLTGENRQYNVAQYGNNNLLNQVEGRSTVLQQGYNVEMRGNGIRMTITQGNVPQ